METSHPRGCMSNMVLCLPTCPHPHSHCVPIVFQAALGSGSLGVPRARRGCPALGTGLAARPPGWSSLPCQPASLTSLVQQRQRQL